MTRARIGGASAEQALEALYRRHAGDVYRYALAVLDSRADAEDVTQKTFINAYRAIEGGERPRQARSWLRAIAHNLCRQHFRQAARRPRAVALDEDVGELVPDAETPTIEDLVRALKVLPYDQRAALVMREFEGRKLQEIAGDLDISAGAVETLLFRARRGLREQLEGNLSCLEAEQAISRQLDGTLARDQRGALRAHLRQCQDCARLARRVRAQRRVIRSLTLVPLPMSLARSPLGPGAAATGVAGGSALAGPLLAKVVGAAVATVALAGMGYEGASHHLWPFAHGVTRGEARGTARRASHHIQPHLTSSAVQTRAEERSTPLLPSMKLPHSLRPERSTHPAKGRLHQAGAGTSTKPPAAGSAAAHVKPHPAKPTTPPGPPKPKPPHPNPHPGKPATLHKPKKPRPPHGRPHHGKPTMPHKPKKPKPVHGKPHRANPARSPAETP